MSDLEQIAAAVRSVKHTSPVQAPRPRRRFVATFAKFLLFLILAVAVWLGIIYAFSPSAFHEVIDRVARLLDRPELSQAEGPARIMLSVAISVCVVLLIVAIFIWPASIASHRKHPSVDAIRLLVILSLFVPIFWLVAMVWALSVPRRQFKS